jgi:hypothetical protein
MAITSADPNLGFLGLVISDAIYITISDTQTSFAPPPNPDQPLRPLRVSPLSKSRKTYANTASHARTTKLSASSRSFLSP